MGKISLSSLAYYHIHIDTEFVYCMPTLCYICIHYDICVKCKKIAEEKYYVILFDYKFIKKM